MVVCRNASEEEIKELVMIIKKKVLETDYSCSIGYCHSQDGEKDLETMVKESDKMMYEDKAYFYQTTGKDRRKV